MILVFHVLWKIVMFLVMLDVVFKVKWSVFLHIELKNDCVEPALLAASLRERAQTAPVYEQHQPKPREITQTWQKISITRQKGLQIAGPY